jgi:hypothetical protein
MDYDGDDRSRSIWNAPESLRHTLLSQHTRLFTEELAILEPHVCLFFSGPYYDDFIKATLPACEVVACGDAPVRELARLTHSALPTASFRTYHPAFLSRGNRWSYIEAMRGLAYDG